MLYILLLVLHWSTAFASVPNTLLPSSSSILPLYAAASANMVVTETNTGTSQLSAAVRKPYAFKPRATAIARFPTQESPFSEITFSLFSVFPIYLLYH